MRDKVVRKLLLHNRLDSPPGPWPRAVAPAFSLAELVVSMGILVLMLSLVGQVFHLTVQSTGQATALTEVTQAIRTFEETLREDLRGVQAGRSVMFIQGNPVKAYWTQAGREADANADPADGYPHAADPDRDDQTGNLVAPRADILMFYTARRGASYLDPGVHANLQQVVYGHAELGEYVKEPAGTDPFRFESVQATFSPADVSELPASEWHVARRATLLFQTPAPVIGVNMPLSPTSVDWLRDGKRDAMGLFDYEALVLRPSALGPPGPDPWFLPPILASILADPSDPPIFARSRLDPTPPPLLLTDEPSGRKFYGMGHQLLPRCASFKVEWALDPHSKFVSGRLDGVGEMFWFDPADPGDPTPGATNPDPDPLRALQGRIDQLSKEPNTQATVARLESLLYERTYDGGMWYSLTDRFRSPDHSEADPNSAWPEIDDANGDPSKIAIFTASRPRDSDDNGFIDDFVQTSPDPIFPGALRITIDVFDDQQRLERPVRHVMVIPVGG